MKHLSLLIMLIGVGACAADTSNGFSSTGSYNVDNQLGDDLSGDVDDTDDTDTGTVVDENAPTLLYAEADLETSTSAVLLTLGYIDKQADLEGGYMVCQFEVDGGNTRDCLGSSGSQIPIDDKSARIDEDEDGNAIIESRLSLTVSGDEFYFELSLIDAEGNTSETIGVAAK